MKVSNIRLPGTAMILEATYYGYASTNCSEDTPVRIYRKGNLENRTWIPEVVGQPVMDEFDDLTEAVRYAECRATVMQDFTGEAAYSNIDSEKLKKVIAKLLPKVDNEKNKKVLRARFGLKPFDKSYTLVQIADAMGVTPEVIRQRQVKALRQLRYHGRDILMPFIRETA